VKQAIKAEEYYATLLRRGYYRYASHDFAAFTFPSTRCDLAGQSHPSPTINVSGLTAYIYQIVFFISDIIFDGHIG
jgi:hypothetical protein